LRGGRAAGAGMVEYQHGRVSEALGVRGEG
jgi:hypothetical protein